MLGDVGEPVGFRVIGAILGKFVGKFVGSGVGGFEGARVGCIIQKQSIIII